MTLAAVIINWNAAEETIACVNSLIHSTGAGEIYVVDNNSAGQDKERLQRLTGRVTFLFNAENLGFSGASNVGILRAVADGHTKILLLNNDARISRRDLDRLLASLERHPDVGVIGPILYDSAAQISNAGGREIGLHYITHRKKAPEKEGIYDVDYVSGTVFLARAETFKTCGLLDTRYFFSGEIADFCRRLKTHKNRLGRRFRVVIDPRAGAFHGTERSSQNRETLYTYYTVRNRYLYLRKFMGYYVPLLALYWLGRHLHHASQCVRSGRKAAVGFILRGIADGLKGRYGRIADEKG